MNDFIASKETLNAKTFKRNENNVQSILYRRAVNEFFKIDHRNNKTKASQIYDNDTFDFR